MKNYENTLDNHENQPKIVRKKTSKIIIIFIIANIVKIVIIANIVNIVKIVKIAILSIIQDCQDCRYCQYFQDCQDCQGGRAALSCTGLHSSAALWIACTNSQRILSIQAFCESRFI